MDIETILGRTIKNNKTECLEFVGCHTNHGYGNVRRNGKMEMAHRVVWEHNNGTIQNGMHVLHKCDNPSCLNIKHLFLGTHLDNMHDKKTKGRCANGTIPDAKKIALIRTLRRAGMKYADIAKVAGASCSQAFRIANQQSWK